MTFKSMFQMVVIVGCAAYVVTGPARQTANAQTALYRVDIDVTWSSTTHPGAILPISHFDSFSGATHSDAVTFWEEGQLASPGVTQEAEAGISPNLDTELDNAVTAGTAGSTIHVPGWICPDEVVNANCVAPSFSFEIHEDFPLVTLIAMIGPSPDWFVGVSALSLRNGGQWVDEVVVDLLPYDGGTRSNNATFDLGGPLTNPPDPITVITDTSGPFIGGASLGTMTFVLVPEPTTAAIIALGSLVPLRRRKVA